jgi:hypothetical protein
LERVIETFANTRTGTSESSPADSALRPKLIALDRTTSTAYAIRVYALHHQVLEAAKMPQWLTNKRYQALAHRTAEELRMVGSSQLLRISVLNQGAESLACRQQQLPHFDGGAPRFPAHLCQPRCRAATQVLRASKAFERASLSGQTS